MEKNDPHLHIQEERINFSENKIVIPSKFLKDAFTYHKFQFNNFIPSGVIAFKPFSLIQFHLQGTNTDVYRFA